MCVTYVELWHVPSATCVGVTMEAAATVPVTKTHCSGGLHDPRGPNLPPQLISYTTPESPFRNTNLKFEHMTPLLKSTQCLSIV